MPALLVTCWIAAAPGGPECQGERSFDTTGWRLSLVAPLEPKTGGSQLARRRGERWQVLELKADPASTPRSFEPLTVSSTEIDADGTVVFVASWPGSPDQAHGVGRGIYRLRP